MKTILISFLALSLFACSENTKVEIGQKTTLKVNPVFNAGNVMHGEIIEAVFEITNVGDYPLVIADAQPSCSCTVAEKPKEPIAPGKSAKIKALVKTENASPGKLSKEVRLTSNTEPSLTVLKINATVMMK